MNKYRFNADKLSRCCVVTLRLELLRRKEAKEPLMKDQDTLTCECGKQIICEPSKRDGQLRWGFDEGVKS